MYLVVVGNAFYGCFGILRYFPHITNKLMEDLDQKVKCLSTNGFYIAFIKHQNNRSRYYFVFVVF